MTPRTSVAALVVALAGLAVVGRLSLIAVPNISLSFLVVFLAGVAYGVRVGAAVGLVSRLCADLLISGVNPVLVPMSLVEAALGATAGLLHRTVNLGQLRPARGLLPRSTLILSGILFTCLFSVLADTADWLFFTWILPHEPSLARTVLWGTLVLRGLAFSFPAVVFNGLVFPVVVPPVLDALRNAGLLPEPDLAPAPAASDAGAPETAP